VCCCPTLAGNFRLENPHERIRLYCPKTINVSDKCILHPATAKSGPMDRIDDL